MIIFIFCLQATTKRQKYERISEKKISTTTEALCKSYPPEFLLYLNYCRNLQFSQPPDYMYLRQLFRILFRTLNHQFDYVFDWTILKQNVTKESSSTNAVAYDSSQNYNAQNRNRKLGYTSNAITASAEDESNNNNGNPSNTTGNGNKNNSGTNDQQASGDVVRQQQSSRKL